MTYNVITSRFAKRNIADIGKYIAFEYGYTRAIIFILGGGAVFGIRYATQADKDFWFTLDRHITMQAFDSKIRDMQAYVIYDSNKPMGVLRYNLFWDNIPFVNLIELHEAYYGKGFGTQAMKHWENEMQTLGYSLVMTSTQTNEQSQHFYRKLGYKDRGCLLLNDDPAEIFFVKQL